MVEVPFRWVVTSKLVERVSEEYLTFIEEFLLMRFVNMKAWDRADTRVKTYRRMTKKKIQEKLRLGCDDFVLGLITRGYIARVRNGHMGNENDVMVKRVPRRFRQRVKIPEKVPKNLFGLMNHLPWYVSENRVSEDWNILAMGCLGIMRVRSVS